MKLKLAIIAQTTAVIIDGNIWASTFRTIHVFNINIVLLG